MNGRHGDRTRQQYTMVAASGVAAPIVEPKLQAVSEESDDANEKLLKRARSTAYRYLTIRPRSSVEVERKLHDRKFPPDIVSSVIAHLIKLDYLNDEQFARQWAASRVRSRGFGRRRLEQELRSKGISRETIKDTLDALFEEAPEADVARKEAAKKLRTLTRFEPEVRRRRLAGFLERKGHSSEIIRTILRSIRLNPDSGQVRST